MTTPTNIPTPRTDAAKQSIPMSSGGKLEWLQMVYADQMAELERENVVLRKCLQDVWDADEMGYLLDEHTEECVQCGEKRRIGSVRQVVHKEECVQGWIEKALNPPTTI